MIACGAKELPDHLPPHAIKAAFPCNPMTILEYSPAQAEILDFINDAIAQIQAEGATAKYVVMGTTAYEHFRQALAVRLHRKPKDFEIYNYLPIVLDPFRTEQVCVLPGPGECRKGVVPYRLDA